MIHVHTRRIHCLKISDSQRYAVTVGLDDAHSATQTMTLKVWYITEHKSQERYCDIKFNFVESRTFRNEKVLKFEIIKGEFEDRLVIAKDKSIEIIELPRCLEPNYSTRQDRRFQKDLISVFVNTNPEIQGLSLFKSKKEIQSLRYSLNLNILAISFAGGDGQLSIYRKVNS